MKPLGIPLLLMAAFAASAMAESNETALRRLEDPSQAVRDAAAAEIRASFKMPDRQKWDDLVAKLTPGMEEVEARKLLAPWLGELRLTHGSMGHESYRLRVDDAHTIGLTYTREERKVHSAEVIDHMLSVGVKPPADFSGTWRNYFVNGRKWSEIEYRDGLHHGEHRSYHSNGERCVEQHYVHGKCHGSDMGYYASGKIYYRGEYKDGKRSGTWIFFNEDGSELKREEIEAPGGEQ